MLCLITMNTLQAEPPEGRRPSPWSAGVFVASDSQPYEGAGRSVRIFPSVSYRGERLKWNGPLIQYKWIQEPQWSFSTHALVQFAPYREDDAPILNGLGDRSDTLIGGVDLLYQPYPALILLASLDTEVLGAYDGLQATVGFQHAIGTPRDRFSGSLGAGLMIQDQNWTRYFVGVPEAKATADRPAHRPDASMHPYTSAQFLVRLHPRWSWFTLARVEFLDDTWRDSPLISDAYRLTAFTALNFSF